MTGRNEYPFIYDANNSGAEALMFADLHNPDVKKRALQLYRRNYDENDIQELLKDRRFVAGIDAYGKNLLSHWRMKEPLFGDLNANPRDLELFTFLQLCMEIARRIQAREIDVPPGLEEEFPEFYRPPNSAPP
jgi:hypothetical protein